MQEINFKKYILNKNIDIFVSIFAPRVNFRYILHIELNRIGQVYQNWTKNIAHELVKIGKYYFKFIQLISYNGNKIDNLI